MSQCHTQALCKLAGHDMRLQMRYGFERCEPFHIVCSADVPRTIGVIKVG